MIFITKVHHPCSQSKFSIFLIITMGRKKSANKKEKHDFHDDYSSRIMGTFDETEVLNDEEDACTLTRLFHANRRSPCQS